MKYLIYGSFRVLRHFSILLVEICDDELSLQENIYEEEDNGWRKFATIPITGNIDSQTIKLQEGLYLAKVKRLKDKTENLMYIHIKSNFRTTIELIETKDHYFPDDEKPIKISDH